MFLQASARQGSMCHAWCCSARIVGVLLASNTALAVAQRPDTSGVAGKARLANVTAEQYQPVFEQFRRMALRSDSVAPVHNLTLRRDVIELHLEDGNLFLGTPVAGRTIAAVFVGHGSVSLAAPLAIERRELRRVLGDSTLNARISAVAFLFTDSTLAELGRQVTFGPRPSEAPSSGKVQLVPVRIELENGGHAFVRVSVRGSRSEAVYRLPALPTEVELNPLQSVLAEVKTEDWE
jgi:hypothetical protein